MSCNRCHRTCGRFGARIMAGIERLLRQVPLHHSWKHGVSPLAPPKQPQHGHSLRGISSPCHTHTRSSSHAAFHSKARNRHARSLPGSRAVSLSSATASPPRGIRYLNKHPSELCTSAPASAPPKLFSAFHQTPSPASCDFPGCLSHPLDREEVPADPGAGCWDNRDFANSPQGTSLLPPHSESSSGM